MGGVVDDKELVRRLLLLDASTREQLEAAVAGCGSLFSGSRGDQATSSVRPGGLADLVQRSLIRGHLSAGAARRQNLDS